MKALRKFKDAAIEQAVLMFARSKFERYGELQSVSVDTAERELSAEVLLKGETEAVTISHANYRIESQGDKKVMVLHNIKISKEWAQNLLDDRFAELTIPIPDFVSSLLK